MSQSGRRFGSCTQTKPKSRAASAQVLDRAMPPPPQHLHYLHLVVSPLGLQVETDRWRSHKNSWVHCPSFKINIYKTIKTICCHTFYQEIIECFLNPDRIHTHTPIHLAWGKTQLAQIPGMLDDVWCNWGNDAAWEAGGGGCYGTGREQEGAAGEEAKKKKKTRRLRRAGRLPWPLLRGRVRRLSKQVAGFDNNPGWSTLPRPWVSACSPAAIQQLSSKTTVVLRKLGGSLSAPHLFTLISHICQPLMDLYSDLLKDEIIWSHAKLKQHMMCVISGSSIVVRITAWFDRWSEIIGQLCVVHKVLTLISSCC